MLGLPMWANASEAMATQLNSEVLAAVAGAEDLSAEGRALAGAALVGADALQDALRGLPDTAPLQRGDTRSTGAAAAEIFVTRIAACGFRGIAEKVELTLVPGPGLVLIAGRNGSGKSSLAEACELALSGTSVRASSSTVWREGLTNIHHEGDARVEVDLRVGGSEEVALSCTLSSDSLDGLRSEAQCGGTPYDLEQHGWEDAVSRYRPLLTYGELAALSSAKRSELYDPINRILGLEQLTTADRLLTRATTDEGRVLQEAADAKASLDSALAMSEDPRAGELRKALAATAPDYDLAQSILEDAAGPSAEARQTLRQ